MQARPSLETDVKDLCDEVQVLLSASPLDLRRAVAVLAKLRSFAYRALIAGDSGSEKLLHQIADEVERQLGLPRPPGKRKSEAAYPALQNHRSTSAPCECEGLFFNDQRPHASYTLQILTQPGQDAVFHCGHPDDWPFVRSIANQSRHFRSVGLRFARLDQYVKHRQLGL